MNDRDEVRRYPLAEALPQERLEAEAEELDRLSKAPPWSKLLGYLKLGGPGFLGAATTLGAGTVHLPGRIPGHRRTKPLSRPYRRFTDDGPHWDGSGSGHLQLWAVQHRHPPHRILGTHVGVRIPPPGQLDPLYGSDQLPDAELWPGKEGHRHCRELHEAFGWIPDRGDGKYAHCYPKSVS